MAGQSRVTPTIQRRRLGNALRLAREQAGKTQEEAAAAIDARSTKISRIELGQSGLTLTDLRVLFDFYGIAHEDRGWMEDLARAGRKRGRWSAYRKDLPNWFRRFVELESSASEIRWYQTEAVPGILQIEDYIHAMLTTAQPRATDEEVDRQVHVRLQRQSVVQQPDESMLRFILSESAIRRVVGDAPIMRAQLRHIAEMAERPNVELQVLPFDAKTYQAATFAFVILRFESDAASDVVYLEDFTNAAYVDGPDEVQAYTSLWNRLQAAALGPVESRHLILRIAGEEQ
jgi:transcriptional regulator with XRE-family HTH domain